MKRLVYTNEQGEIVKGVCSNFLCNDPNLSRIIHEHATGYLVLCGDFLSSLFCHYMSGDLKPGADVKITGPVGKEMLMPKDPNATIIMVIKCHGFGVVRSRLFYSYMPDPSIAACNWHWNRSFPLFPVEDVL